MFVTLHLHESKIIQTNTKNPSGNLNCLLFDEQLLFFLMKKKLRKNNVKNLITS